MDARIKSAPYGLDRSLSGHRDLCRSRLKIHAVIPGRAFRASPESITTRGGYGFRACAPAGAIPEWRLSFWAGLVRSPRESGRAVLPVEHRFKLAECVAGIRQHHASDFQHPTTACVS